MNKRDLILDSLEDLLTEEKGASCSVREIAQKAGIAKGGIYYYFQSKEEIFDALVERTIIVLFYNAKNFLTNHKIMPYKNSISCIHIIELHLCLHN